MADSQKFVLVTLAAVAGFMLAAYLIKQIDKDRPADEKLFPAFYSA